jgi:hypothetical protein
MTNAYWSAPAATSARGKPAEHFAHELKLSGIEEVQLASIKEPLDDHLGLVRVQQIIGVCAPSVERLSDALSAEDGRDVACGNELRIAANRSLKTPIATAAASTVIMSFAREASAAAIAAFPNGPDASSMCRGTPQQAGSVPRFQPGHGTGCPGTEAARRSERRPRSRPESRSAPVPSC